jgi:hypothetical protein
VEEKAEDAERNGGRRSSASMLVIEPKKIPQGSPMPWPELLAAKPGWY